MDAKENLFELQFLREEQHLALPTLTSLVLVREIHDVLYQYLVDEEKERLFDAFLDMLKRHVSRQREGNGPFSVRIEELNFLEAEGLRELKYMNWIEVPVYVFQVKSRRAPGEAGYEEERERVARVLDDLLVYNWAPGTDIIYTYPQQVP
ncbi:MAG: hypothetical protein QHH05_04025 [Syntrophomonadaceae bacterium]|jgi:hypothetical protein|nr:hypothetical protein [Syntrophomonadaceae bacterium]MDH7497595.1 hypothetical protein [Syntrophomonadaceae bacterium]